jgi:PTS system nitrogen regulatory IIA component
MKLADLIAPDRVVLGLRAGDKAELLAELAKRSAAAVSVDAATILSALASREVLGSTGLGRGFALPHARVPGLGGFFGLFARLARPIDFDAIDRRPVDIVFLLLIPEAARSEHVTALAAIARRMRDDGCLRELRAANSAAALFRLLVAEAPTSP